MSDNNITSTVKKQADWAIVMGVLTAAMGVAMMVYPIATATVTTLFLGWSLIFAAVAQVVFAIYSPGSAPFLLKILLAIVYGIAGVGLVANPAVGVLSLTVALGIMLLFQSALEFGVAIYFRNEISPAGSIFSALVSMALGLMILFQWPFSSVWAVGTMVGAGVLTAGITRIVIAGKIHHGASAFEKLANA